MTGIERQPVKDHAALPVIHHEQSWTSLGFQTSLFSSLMLDHALIHCWNESQSPLKTLASNQDRLICSSNTMKIGFYSRAAFIYCIFKVGFNT